MGDWGGHEGGGYGPPGAPPPYEPAARGPQPDPFAIGSVSVGSVALLVTVGLGCCCGLFACGGGLVGAVALGLGVYSLRRIAEQPELYSGKGLAIGGVVTGGLSLVSALLRVLLSVLSIMPRTGGMGEPVDLGHFFGG